MMTETKHSAFLSILSVLLIFASNGCTGRPQTLSATVQPTETFRVMTQVTPTFTLNVPDLITPSPTLTVRDRITPSPAAMVTSTPTQVPRGVFALLFYPPLIMDYDPSLWVDKTVYTSLDRFRTNELQAKGLATCKLTVHGPTGFNTEYPIQKVILGRMSYTVIIFEDLSTGSGAIYFEDQTLVGFNYEYGVPMPGISSSALEWNQCKELGENVLSTLRVP